MLGHFGFGREVQIPLHYRVKNRFLSTLVHDDGGGGGLDHCGTVGWHGGGKLLSWEDFAGISQ